MEIKKLVENANLLADEDYPAEESLPFINDALARINIEANSNYPFVSEDTLEYTAIPEKWVYSLLVPFLVGRFKQKDSSQFEYSDAYAEFMANLALFKTNYTIPEEYKDPDVPDNPLESDWYASPWKGWF